MALPQEALDQLWCKAHTEHGFEDKPVDIATIEKAIELALLGPSSYNCGPLRVIIVQSPEGKKKLVEAIAPTVPGNVNQTTEAPINLIVCTDKEFEDKLDKTMPFVPNAKNFFKNDHHDSVMNLNGSLQAGYLILALRALGLNVGPEITVPKVDEVFELDKLKWESKFIINVGYGVPEKRYPRAPRLTMDEATKRL